MSSFIVSISGNVKHKIIIDPGVWIFDDRKVDLNTYFTEEQTIPEDEDGERLAKAWNLHRSQGSNAVSNGNKVNMSKKDFLEKSFGIALYPFLKNAEPAEDATSIIFKRQNAEDVRCALEEMNNIILGFSNKGKPLVEDGPLHLYYRDGSNKEAPITNIIDIVIE